MHLDQILFLLTKHVLFIFVLSIVLKFSQTQAKTRQPWRKRVLKSFAEWQSIQSPRQEVFIRRCLSLMSANELSVEHCWPMRSELTKWEATDQCSNATVSKHYYWNGQQMERMGQHVTMKVKTLVSVDEERSCSCLSWDILTSCRASPFWDFSDQTSLRTMMCHCIVLCNEAQNRRPWQ